MKRKTVFSGQCLRIPFFSPFLPLSFAHASFRMRAVSPFSIAATKKKKKQGKEKEKKKFCNGKERESEMRGVTK